MAHAAGMVIIPQTYDLRPPVVPPLAASFLIDVIMRDGAFAIALGAVSAALVADLLGRMTWHDQRLVLLIAGMLVALYSLFLNDERPFRCASRTLRALCRHRVRPLTVQCCLLGLADSLARLRGWALHHSLSRAGPCFNKGPGGEFCGFLV